MLKDPKNMSYLQVYQNPYKTLRKQLYFYNTYPNSVSTYNLIKFILMFHLFSPGNVRKTKVI